MCSRYHASIYCLLLSIFSTGSLAASTAAALIEPLASQSLLLDGTRAGDRLIAVGERGHILISDDQGKHWTQTPAPIRTTLTAVSFSSRNDGWAVGHDASILHSDDNGQHWQLVYQAPELEAPLLDILFITPERGIAIGAYGLYLSTRDSGQTWHQQTISDDDVHLNHISRMNNGRLIIAAEAGIVYISDNNGDNWQSLATPYHGSFFGSLPLTDTLLLFGLRGHLFQGRGVDLNTDHADLWQTIDSHTRAMLTSALLRNNGDILLTGHDGVILYRRPDEPGFTLIPQPGRLAISSAVEAGDGTVWLLGEQGLHALQMTAP